MILYVRVNVCAYSPKQILISFGLGTELLLNSSMAQQKYLLKSQKNSLKDPFKVVILGENYKQIKS